jgi:hypothetical protein
MWKSLISKSAITILLFCSFSVAAEYYVDFLEGNDTNSGTGQTEAWKHCPGDPLAEGLAAGALLSGGDIVYFKGGVYYRGEIRINTGGTAGNPIIFKGDGWGTEKAIIDGSDALAGNWIQCLSGEQCDGNANFSKIYSIEAPEGYDFFAGFYEDNNFLWFSQDPNPTDPFYHDGIDEFITIPLGTDFSTTHLSMPSYFTQSNPDYWDGAYIIAWHIPNVTSTEPVTSYNPATSTINFPDLGGGGVYTDRDSYYAMLNHKSIIDRPGEYCYDEEENKIYLWPLNSDNPNTHNYSVNRRETGIIYSSKQNIIIEGLIVQNFTMGIRATTESTDNVIIRNNVIRNLRSNNWYALQLNGSNITAENNRIENCNRAVGILVAGNNQTVKNNYVKRTSRQGIWFMGVDYGQITGNTVDDINGTHSNGISAYLYNKDILIASNKVINSEISLTFHGDNNYPDHNMNLTIYNNYFESDAHSWGNNARDIKVINNVFQEGLFFSDTDTFTVSINNVFHGGGDADITNHNIYTNFGWWQQERYGWAMQEGEIDWTEKDINEIFSDIENENINLIENSPAINAGINPVQYLPVELFPDYDFYQDINGNPRSLGSIWDIGPVQGIYTDVNVGNGYSYSLSQNYPNPFNPVTTIKYSIPQNPLLNGVSGGQEGRGIFVQLRVFNILGQVIATLVEKEQPAADYKIIFDGSALTSGIYFYRIIAGNFIQTRKMMLLK